MVGGDFLGEVIITGWFMGLKATDQNWSYSKTLIILDFFLNHKSEFKAKSPFEITTFTKTFNKALIDPFGAMYCEFHFNSLCLWEEYKEKSKRIDSFWSIILLMRKEKTLKFEIPITHFLNQNFFHLILSPKFKFSSSPEKFFIHLIQYSSSK